jgi:hypothetical protein
MAPLDRGIVTWTGGPIGTGATVMYAIPGGSFMSAIHDFFDAIKIDLSTYVRLSFPSVGDTIESTTGALVGSWSGATLADVVGTGGGFAAAPTGGVVNWLTNTIFPAVKPAGAPHRGRGRSFIVPLATNSYDSDGTLQSGTITRWNTAASALVAAGTDHFVIYQRPHPKGASNGLFGKVVDHKLKDRVAVLTSRR